MKNIKVVAAVIRDQHNRILCAQKSESAQGEDAYKWEFPGGKVEAREKSTNALKREIKEELSLDIEVHSLINESKHVSQTHNLLLKTYFSTIIKGTITTNVHNQIRWMNINDLHDLDWLDADKAILDDVIKYLNFNL